MGQSDQYPLVVAECLNRYFSKELGKALPIEDLAVLRRQRSLFLDQFGPDKLARLSDSDLLYKLPLNTITPEPMDYWLEFKKDDDFDAGLFGSIAGGAAWKYGPWQSKKHGLWCDKHPRKAQTLPISDEEALLRVLRRKTELLSAVEAIRSFSGLTAEQIDPQQFHNAIVTAAPRWGKSAWLHKYLHLVFPELVTWNATLPWAQSALYYIGQVPRCNDIYALDIDIIRCYNSLSSLSNYAIEQRYRVAIALTPRTHWVLGGIADTQAMELMLSQECLAFGPARVGNLSENTSLYNNKRDLQSAVEKALQASSLPTNGVEKHNLITILYNMKEGDIIAVMKNPSVIVAVGEVVADYQYSVDSVLPHRIAVNWQYKREITLSSPIDSDRLTELNADHEAVATIESTLLINGIGPKTWEHYARHTVSPSTDDNSDVIEFLHRLEQIHAISEKEPYKSGAYRYAREQIKSCDVPISRLVRDGQLRKLPGIGDIIERDIVEFLETGTSTIWEDVTRTFPSSLLELTEVPGLGGGRIRRLFLELHVTNLQELQQCSDERRIETLPGFGPSITNKVKQFFFDKHCLRSVATSPLDSLTRKVADMLDRKRQVILYGPPGTGKTYHAERIALELVARRNYRSSAVGLSELERAAIYGHEGGEPYILTCAFHPMYGYEDFIEGYRPDAGGFRLESGVFQRVALAAQSQPTKLFILIIDEINRGNIPRIFGELMTLIEASKRGTTSVVLPLSGRAFSVPDNLYIIGTMNTADRSIALLDTALRRRFAFLELLPQPQLLSSSFIGDVSLSAWLRALNRRIVEQLGPDGRNLQVGHAYLMPGGKPVVSVNRIGEIVRDEIWPLLQEYCYETPEKLAAILGADKGGLYDRTQDNLRFELFERTNEHKLTEALNAIVSPKDRERDAELTADLEVTADTDDESVDYQGG